MPRIQAAHVVHGTAKRQAACNGEFSRLMTMLNGIPYMVVSRLESAHLEDCAYLLNSTLQGMH